MTWLEIAHPSAAAADIPVPDLDGAVRYYRRFFGFDIDPDDQDGLSTRMTGHGVGLRLVLDPSGQEGGTVPDRGGWSMVPAAAVQVRHPELVRRQLDDLGAHLVSPEDLEGPSSAAFGFRDPYGNLVAVSPRPGAVNAVRRGIALGVADVAFRWRERRRALEERQRLHQLRDFYRGLADRSSIYYLVVGPGLLHWAAKTAGYIPSSVNLVLLGTNLSPEEQAWIRRHSGRPFHHLGIELDDAGVWEMLFTVNEHDFGWVAAGCFVLDPALFADLGQVSTSTSVNCVWSWPAESGFALAATHLLFVRAATIAAVRGTGVPAGAGVYSYRRFNRQVEGRRCYARTPTRSEVALLRRQLAPGESGRPRPPGGGIHFDPTVAYQIMARSCGFSPRLIRGLRARGHVGGADVEDEGSDEVFHLGGLGDADVLEEANGYFHDAGVRLLYLIAEFVVLSGTAASLPASYRLRLQRVRAELADRGLAPEDVFETARRHLTEVYGLSDRAAAAVLASATDPTG